jgi:hypothetical protein
MPDTVDLMLNLLEELEQQDKAGINPEREDIDRLFDLARSERRRRAERPPAPTKHRNELEIVRDADVALGRRRGDSGRRLRKAS